MTINYTDVHNLRNHPTVKLKTHVAIADVAKDILVPEVSGTSERTVWAKEAIQDPATKAPQIVHFVLLDNLAAANTNAVITASDAAYKANVSTAIDSIVGPATGV